MVFKYFVHASIFLDLSNSIVDPFDQPFIPENPALNYDSLSTSKRKLRH